LDVLANNNNNNNNSTKTSIQTVIDYTSFISDHTKDFTGREWVFDKIDAWLADPAAASVFLLVGGPGTGKSAILARLTQFSLGQASADGCAQLAPGFLAYYHFCQAQHDATLNPLRFVEALSLALANRYQSFAKALYELKQGDTQITINANQNVTTAADGTQISNVVIQNLNVGSVSARVAFDQVVRRPLEVLCQKGFQEPIVVLVDSLDEARTWREEENILTLLAETLDDPRDLPPNVCFVLASRPDERVLQTLGLLPSLDLTAAVSPNKEEVRLYASTRLAKVALDANLRDRLASRLERASDGNFLYARYVLDDWLARPQEITEESTLDLPAGLNEIYRKFLQRELAHDNEKWEDRYQPLLGLLAVAREEGLTAATLAGASGKKPREVQNALRASSQYIAGPQPDGPFRIYHQSFRDFLLEDAAYTVYPAEAHQLLANFFTSEYSGTWHTCQDKYALRYTTTHLISALEIVTSQRERRQLTDLLVSLLTDYGFLEARVRRGWVYELSSDFSQTLLQLPKDHRWRHVLELLAELLRSDAQFISDHPTAFFQSCWNRGWWFDAPQAANFYEPPVSGWQRGQAPWDWQGEKLYALLERWREQRVKIGAASFWLRALRAPPDPLGSVQLGVFRGPEVFRGEDNESFKIEISPNEQWLVCGGGTGCGTGRGSSIVKLYDLAGSGKELSSVAFQDKENVNDIAFSPRGDVIAVALSYAGGVCLLQPPQLVEIGRLFDPKSSSEVFNGVECLAFSPNGHLLVSGHWSGKLIAWDMDSHQMLDSVKGHEHWVWALTFSDDGKELASVGEESPPADIYRVSSRLRRWRLDPGFQPVQTRRLDKVVLDLAYSPDGGRLACPLHSEIIVYDLGSKDVRKFQVGEAESTGCLAFSPDGKSLLAGAGDASSAAYIYCWDLESGQLKWKLPGHNFLVNDLIIFQNGKRLLTAGDYTIRLWDLERTASGFILNSVEPDIDHAILSPDGALVFTASKKFETVRARRVWDGKMMHKWLSHDGEVYSLALSQDGRWMACGCRSGAVHVWNVRSGVEHTSFRGHKSVVEALAFSPPDGHLLATGSWDGKVLLVDMYKRQEIGTLRGHSNRSLTNVSFSSDGRLLLTYDNNRIIVWDVKTQRKLSHYGGEGKKTPLLYRSTCFSDDSRYVVVEDIGEGLWAWEAATGKRVAVEDVHRQAFYRLKMRQPGSYSWEPGSYSWEQHHMEEDQRQTVKRHTEMVLQRADTHEPVAWLPIPYGKILYSALAEVWGMHRGGHLYIYALERI
jgi:WD40 repeat protein